jgi:hypothetical protein
MAMAMLTRRMGISATIHGFRTSFRTWAGETGVVFEVAEHCLSHAVGNQASQAYNRTTLLERRRPIMSAWAQFLSGTDADNVVPIRRIGSRPRASTPDRPETKQTTGEAEP